MCCKEIWASPKTDGRYFPLELRPILRTSKISPRKKRSVIDTARIVCVAGSTQLSSVRLSVCLSVPSDHRTPLLQVCCCGPGKHEISIDCWSSVGRMRTAPRCQRTKNNHSNQINRSKIRNKSLVVNAVATICVNRTGLLVNN